MIGRPLRDIFQWLEEGLQELSNPWKPFVFLRHPLRPLW